MAPQTTLKFGKITRDQAEQQAVRQARESKIQSDLAVKKRNASQTKKVWWVARFVAAHLMVPHEP